MSAAHRVAHWTASWRAALRLARRDALRAKGRSALVIALIGLPVLLLGVVDIAYRTYQLDPGETVTRAIGSADVGLQWTGEPRAFQGDAGWLAGGGAEGSGSPATPTARDVTALLPHGSRVIEWRTSSTPLTFRTRAGLAQATETGLDYADPIAVGLVVQRTGRAPRHPDEVAITAALAAAMGLRTGETLRAQDPRRDLRVVGTVTGTSNRADRTVFTVPADVAVSAAVPNVGSGGGGITWLARTPRAVSWTDVLAANRHGLLVLSRSVYLHPSAAARAATARLDASSGGGVQVIAVLTVVAGMALLEVVLLAGPAFAVGAKRRRRDLALIMAGGGSPADVRLVVLAGGAVLGLVAGVGAALTSVAVAAAGLPMLWHRASRLPGHFDVRPAELLLLAGLGLLAAVAASVVPARAAARTDVVAALAGRRGASAVRLRWPALGSVLAGLGVVVALLGSRRTGNAAALVILAGVALTEIGLIVCTPALLAAVARLGARFPLAARLAMRDAGRNRSAATPAVAAVMTSVIGAVSILIGVASVEAQARDRYTPSLPMHSAEVELPADARTAEVVPALRATLPVTAAAILHAPAEQCSAGQRRCVLTDLVPHANEYATSQLRPVLVDDGSAAPALFGARAGQVASALRAGKVVVVDPRLWNADATVSLDVARLTVVVEGDGSSGGGTGPSHTVRLPSVRVSGADALVAVVVPPTVAHRLGVPVVPTQAFVRLARLPSDAEVQATTAALHQVLASPNLIIESGYHSRYGTLRNSLAAAAVLIAVLAAIIATALANVDGGADVRTLGAIGAGPHTRRLLSASRSAVIAGLGTIAGVVAGFLVPAAYVLGSQRADPGGGLHFVVPWPDLLAVAAAVPVIAASISLLASRPARS